MNNQNFGQTSQGSDQPPPYNEIGAYPSAASASNVPYSSQPGYVGAPYPTAPPASYPSTIVNPGPPYPTAYGGPGYPTPYGTEGAPPIGFKNNYSQGPTVPPPFAAGRTTEDNTRLIAGGGANVSASSSATSQNTAVIVLTDSERDWTGNSFSDKSIRRAFIRKVFLILVAQLAVTIGVICFFLFCDPVRHWIQTSGSWFYFIAYVTFLITYIILVCCPDVRRSYPSNVICLAVFTLAFSYVAGVISSFHGTEIVLIAMGITAAVCLSLAVFAIQTKIDFTMCSGILFALCMVVFFFGLACIIGGAFMNYKSAYILHCVYAGLAALLFSLFLVYDIQMLVGGHKYELSPEEYIFGSLQLYLDVVYLFLIILSLFGGRE